MSTAIWIGAGGTGRHPTSGAFEDAANWQGGATPATDQDVVFASGKYTVTLTTQPYELGALSIGAGVTLNSVRDANGSGDITVTADSTNSGLINLNSAPLVIGSGATFYNFGQVVGGNDYDLAGLAGDGVFDNYGDIYEGDGSVVEFRAHVNNEAGGRIYTPSGGQFNVRVSLHNDGLISATNGGQVNLLDARQSGTADNLSGGVLTGGQWSAVGNGSYLFFSDPSGLTTIGAGTIVTLSGSGSLIVTVSDAGLDYIEESLTQIAGGGELHVLAGRDYTTGLDLDVAGRLDLGGGTFSSAGLTVDGGGSSTLGGYGVVASNMDVYGAVRAVKNHGDVTLALTGNNAIRDTGGLVGAGVLEIAGGVTQVQDGAQVLAKALVVSGGSLNLGEDLAYSGKLRVSGDGTLDLGGHILRVTGSLSQVNGDIVDGTLQIETTQVSVQGLHLEWAADVRNNGEVDLGGGKLLIDSGVNGNGAFYVSGGATLEFGGFVSSGQMIDLVGSGDKLVFDHAQTFKAGVAEFDAGDTLDFASFAYAGATLSWKAGPSGLGGVLTLTSGADTASIHLNDDHTRSGFHLVDDGAGHAAVTYGASGAAAHADWGGLAT